MQDAVVGWCTIAVMLQALVGELLLNQPSSDMFDDLLMASTVVYFLSVAELLITGIGGLAAFTLALSRPVRRLCLVKWRAFQVEQALLALSLVLILANTINAVLNPYVTMISMSGVVVDRKAIEESVHSNLLFWLSLISRLIHNLAKKATGPTKRAIIRSHNTSKRTLELWQMLEALNSVPDVPMDTYIAVRDHIEDLAHEASMEDAMDSTEAVVDLEELLHWIMKSSADPSEISMRRNDGVDRGPGLRRSNLQVREEICLALLAAQEETREAQWVVVVESLVCTGPQQGAYGIAGTLLSALRWILVQWPIALGMVLAVAVAAISFTAESVIIGLISARLAEYTADISTMDFVIPGLLLGLVGLTSNVAGTTAAALASRMAALLQHEISSRMFVAVCHPEASKMGVLQEGDITARYAKDSTAFLRTAKIVLPWQILYSLITLLSSLIILIRTSAVLAILFVVILPVSYQLAGNRPVKGHKRAALANAHLQGYFNNCVALRRVMALYSAGEFAVSNAGPAIQGARAANLGAAGSQAWTDAFLQIWGAVFQLLAYSIVLIRGHSQLLQGASMEDAASGTVSAILLISRIGPQLSGLQRGVSAMLEIGASMWRLDDAVGNAAQRDLKLKLSTVAGQAAGASEALPLLESEVSFSDVVFKYPGADAPVISDLSVAFPAGQLSCVVGASGAGKSTLLHLLTREQIESRGTVALDGAALSSAAVSEVRRQMGVVMQESTLLNGTLASNIRMGKPGASDQEVRQAAKRAACHDFIAALPDGYETEVGNLSNKQLSGGQAQRVCLARALVRQPRLLLLDEATSALDPATEATVVSTVSGLVRQAGLTVISVTHRLATTQDADQIVVLKGGRVAERGGYQELAGLFGGEFQSLLADAGPEGACCEAALMGKVQDSDTTTASSIRKQELVAEHILLRAQTAPQKLFSTSETWSATGAPRKV